MSEREPQRHEPVEYQAELKFKDTSTAEIIGLIQNPTNTEPGWAELELSRRTALEGKSWRWNLDKVEIIGVALTGDDLKIEKAIHAWEQDGKAEPISDLTARIIAATIHDGMSSSLYSFASTGRIDRDGLDREMVQNLLEVDPLDDLSAGPLEALQLYFIHHGERDVVDGWHERNQW